MVDLIQTGTGDLHAGRKSIFRSESNPESDVNSPEVVFRISSPQRIYEINREIEAAQEKPKKGFKPKEAVRNFFGGIKKSISKKVSNAKDTVKDTFKSGLEKGLATVMGNPRMHIHGLEDNYEEEKEQDVEVEGDWEDQSNWKDQFGNDQNEHWEDRLARFYGTGSIAGNVRGNSDDDKLRVVEDSWEDMEEGGGYYGDEGVIDPGVIQDNYVEVKIEEKPKSMEIFEVEQGKNSNSKSDSRD
ncbi:hypothetical protein TWF718_003304 [Orbilia javanica]|uniref:Uncharacterized protein n=1 Tax=Orbilia javanica TaxID=47235 RepID=A0AAN8MP36_9PEZI